jgi:sugar diacid utilization regulator
MPLFTIPWDTRMVDMTRDFCRRIMNNEQVETRITTTMKNIIFNIGDIESQVQQMERHGYMRDGSFCFISLMLDAKNGQSPDTQLTRLGKMAERIAKRMQDLFIMFSYKGYLILVLVNFSDEEIKSFVAEFLANTAGTTNGWELHFGISSNKMGVFNQKANFEKALSAMEMAKQQSRQYCYYDELGMYKILYAVNDKSVLRNYYKEIMGKLESYDVENSANLTEMLKTYLQNNSSLQIVAEKQFVHRNTVTNQLKKIEEITGYNPFELEDKIKLCMAFYIKAIL